MRILLCGGTGYIGCHTHVVLTERGHDVVVADNFSNSSPRVLERLQRLSGNPVEFHQVDMRDREALARLFAARNCASDRHRSSISCSITSLVRPYGLVTCRRASSRTGTVSGSP